VILNVNHYTCRARSRAWRRTADPKVVTVLGGWVYVEPLPAALVVRQFGAPDGGGQQRRPSQRRAPRGDERADIAGHVRHARALLRCRGGAGDGPRWRASR